MINYERTAPLWSTLLWVPLYTLTSHKYNNSLHSLCPSSQLLDWSCGVTVQLQRIASIVIRRSNELSSTSTSGISLPVVAFEAHFGDLMAAMSELESQKRLRLSYAPEACPSKLYERDTCTPRASLSCIQIHIRGTCKGCSNIVLVAGSVP